MENNELPGWRIICFEHDYGSRTISNLFQELFPDVVETREIELRQVIKKDELLKQLDELNLPNDHRLLFTLGHGTYHHYTYGFAKLSDRISKEYFYHHVDFHHDSGKNKIGNLAAGSFVKDIIEDSNAKEPLLFGCEPKDIDYTTYNRFGSDINWAYELNKKLASLPDDVYCSFDLDALHKSCIPTGYSHGNMSLDTLLRHIMLIKQGKRIIGADIIGLSEYGIHEKIRNRRAHLIYALIAATVADLNTERIKDILIKNDPMLHMEFDKYLNKGPVNNILL